MKKEINLPVLDDQIRDLSVGESVLISGIILTGRDAVHKWLIDTFINGIRQPDEKDLLIYQALKPLMEGGIIYHCGPVIRTISSDQYKIIAAGPTTSIREEAYQADVLRHFNLKGVIGKGGMGAKTLSACKDVPSVYFHAIGGAATLIAETIQNVLGVYKLEFGIPEAIWVLRVKDFPAVVTMDAHNHSLHMEVRQSSKLKLEQILSEE